jgi:hypothetical protein
MADRQVTEDGEQAFLLTEAAVLELIHQYLEDASFDTAPRTVRGVREEEENLRGKLGS